MLLIGDAPGTVVRDNDYLVQKKIMRLVSTMQRSPSGLEIPISF
jgi:hypothetical protein